MGKSLPAVAGSFFLGQGNQFDFQNDQPSQAYRQYSFAEGDVPSQFAPHDKYQRREDVAERRIQDPGEVHVGLVELVHHDAGVSLLGLSLVIESIESVAGVAKRRASSSA